MTVMGGSSSLVVPMVMWGRHPPVHCISSIYLLRDQKTLVSGSSDGQVFLWEVDAQSDKWTMTPRHVLVGHTSPIKCIAKATGGADGHHIVTSSENGEMFCWDTEDGRCIESKKLQGLIHTHIQAYRSPDVHSSGTASGHSGVKLFCCGFYEEIVVMDPFALTVIFQLASRINPDWIASFHVLRPRNRHDDVVLALTTTGTVKVWTLIFG
jgi:WD40 repeat protein